MVLQLERQFVYKVYYTRFPLGFTFVELTLHGNLVNGDYIVSLIVNNNFSLSKQF